MSLWEIYKFVGIPAWRDAAWKQRLRIHGFEVPIPMLTDDDYFLFAGALLAVEVRGGGKGRQGRGRWEGTGKRGNRENRKNGRGGRGGET